MARSAGGPGLRVESKARRGRRREVCFFFQAEDGIRDLTVTGVQTCALPILSPASASVAAGGAAQFTASLRDSAGNVLTGQPVTWASSDSTIATINGSGLATAVAAGTATITATSGGVTGAAALTVTATTPASVASVVVSPTSTSL